MNHAIPTRDFPMFQRRPTLHYLDSAATTYQPESVIAAQAEYYRTSYGPIHRAVYDVSATATTLYEATREHVAEFIGARSADEIIFTRNATEALNLVAWIELPRLRAGDEIVLSAAEHHSNILPWQRVAHERQLTLSWLELNNDYSITAEEIARKITARTKVVAIAHISNVLGTVFPLELIIARAHAVGAKVVVDAAQSVGRLPLAVATRDIDYLAFSGHKMYGPPGIGVLYGKQAHLASAQPLQLGGGMVAQVTRQSATWAKYPALFEAGTPASGAVAGLAAAMQYVTTLGWKEIADHERELVDSALEKFAQHGYLMLYGPRNAATRVGIFSFRSAHNERGVHSHDVSTIANEHGVAVRGGHHCAEPLLHTLGVNDLTRASVGIYTTQKDLEALFQALEAVQAVFGYGIKKGATVPTS